MRDGGRVSHHLTPLQNSFVLYLIYYPAHKIDVERSQQHVRHYSFLPARTEEWTISLLIARVVTLHLVICTLVTVAMLAFVGGPDHQATSSWAAFLGITSVILATIQYVPQIHRTYKRKVMCSSYICSGLHWVVEGIRETEC